MDNEPQKAFEFLKKYGQEHLLNFWNELSNVERESLIKQIYSTDFEMIHNLYVQSYLDDSIAFDRISPLPYMSRFNLSADEIEKYSLIGAEIIKSGRVGVITLAGGQGTRLGFKGPKGAYEINVPPKKSLFEFACDNLKKAESKYGVCINWYIMTSPFNDLATKKYFMEKNFFGYDKNRVKFFVQDTFPVIDVSGRVILDTPYTIKTGSNGNGDVFRAFSSAGFIDDLDRNDIDWIFIGGIDNILQKLIDPLFLGITAYGNYPIASKSVAKNTDEPDWVFANVDGRPSIVDSKNLPDNALDLTNCSNQFLYNQKNILSHLFSTDAFKKSVDANLPYHRAFKKSDFINYEGMKEVASKPNSFKFEKFIFDAFSMFDKMLLLEVDPNAEFAPIKAFTGNATPETALELYIKYV